MRVETRPVTTPRPAIRRRVTPQRTSHAARRDQHDPDTVVRVRFEDFGGLYAYACRGGYVGALVEVVAPLSGAVVLEVEALGRGGYAGPLKRARLVR